MLERQRHVAVEDPSAIILPGKTLPPTAEEYHLAHDQAFACSLAEVKPGKNPPDSTCVDSGAEKELAMGGAT